MSAMRWHQAEEPQPQQTLFDEPIFERQPGRGEYRGIEFLHVRAQRIINELRGAPFGFRYTINPYRGCTHSCTYCFARPTHTYLDLDADRDFERKIVVKVNAVSQLRRELDPRRWRGELVAMGTNTDPYQRAEGRYALMPRIIGALTDSGTPFSVLTKGTMLRRDLPLIADAAGHVDVSAAVSLAVGDPELHKDVEPGTPSPQARLGLVSAIREAGLDCHVMVAPVLPRLTDSVEHLDGLLGAIAAAGATGVTVFGLHLRGSTRGWFMSWLARSHPELVGDYRELYRRGAYLPSAYRSMLHDRVAPLVAKHGLAGDRPSRAAETPAAPTAEVLQPTLF
jgi:DNA repair photolyase